MKVFGINYFIFCILRKEFRDEGFGISYCTLDQLQCTHVYKSTK